MMHSSLKSAVHDFWNAASCGEDLYLLGEDLREQYRHQLARRYELEPFIPPFADFEAQKGQKVLEIGVGLGADHQMFAAAGAQLFGCDLTERAVAHTSQRLELFGLKSDLRVADAENLPYIDAEFDFVYSWGVIHHSPDTRKAADEIHRVLRPGGTAKVMIYHKHSFVGYMLWCRYALARLRFAISLDDIYARYLESPGTKAYTVAAAHQLFSQFAQVNIQTVLTHGDLLSSEAGQRHRGWLLSTARTLFPRRLVRYLFPKNGLFMLVSLKK